jgi:hypothetical protein
VTAHLVVHLPIEFKTFAVRLDPKLLPQSSNFDFKNYENITKKIKKDSSRTDHISTCSYLFDHPSDIPDAVLKLMNLNS